MALILDFIAILFIVTISFLFCNNNYKIKSSINNSSCLLSHMVVGFSGIMFYKLAKQFKLNDIIIKFSNNNENFYSASSINDFINDTTKTDLISTNQAAKLTPIQLKEYSNKLDSIMSNLNALQKSQSTVDPLINVNPANLNTLDLTAQQQYQMFQLDYLNKQLQNSQDILNAQNISDSSVNYKPIKVFSSCVVANANGTTSSDTPVLNQGKNISDTSSSNPATNNILKTISQSNSQTSGPALSPSTGVFNNVLSGIQRTGTVNVNM